MRTRLLILFSTFIAATAAGAAMLAAPQHDRPGPTQARVWIENRNPNEAIPVVLQNDAVPIVVRNVTTSTPMPVRVIGEIGTVPVRLIRQPWDYQTITIQPGQDTAALLTRLGTDGWEAAGVQWPSGSSTMVLFKRPRP